MELLCKDIVIKVFVSVSSVSLYPQTDFIHLFKNNMMFSRAFSKCASGKFRQSLCLIGLGFVLFVAANPQRAGAQGNLLVTPRRIVFEAPTRMQELNLANIGTDTARYLISIMEIRMNEDGSFDQIKTPDTGQLFASKYLRIFPRNVTIAPGESQLVKVQLFKADGITPGEYRSHIYIRAVPVEKPLGEDGAKRDTTQISVKLTAIFGISIPALIRVGENNTKITLTNPTFTPVEGKAPKLGVTLNRSGLMSSYGDLTVECIDTNGKVSQVGMVKGIAVYTPNTTRRFNMDLNTSDGVAFKGGRLRIVYKTQKDDRMQDAATSELSLKDFDAK